MNSKNEITSNKYNINIVDSDLRNLVIDVEKFENFYNTFVMITEIISQDFGHFWNKTFRKYVI